MMKKYIIACIVSCILYTSSFGTVIAQSHLEDLIPDAIEALRTYSEENNVPMSYIRHDLLEYIYDMDDPAKKKVLKMLNMDRELEVIETYEKSVRFEVEGTTAHMYGKIDNNIYTTVQQLFIYHPDLEKIVMIYVPGSLDDFKNFQAIQYIRTKDIILEIGPKGFIASGGVDFLLAGTTRQIYEGASIGIHSRRYDGITDAKKLPKNDERHTPWINFYASIGMEEAYYWFVLNNATADEVHWLTEDELKEFGFTDKLLSEKDFLE